MPDTIARKLPGNEKTVIHSRTDRRYWLANGRLFKEAESKTFCCRFTHEGRRIRFPLKTGDRSKAATRAADAFRLVTTGRMDEAIKKFKPTRAKPARDKSPLTVGQFLDTAVELSSARPQTLDTYVKAFRRIVSEVMGIQSGCKFDAIKGGAKAWRAKVDGVPLRDLTPAAVIAWKNRRLRKAEGDPMQKRAAIVTVNSLIRNAKSLMGKKTLPFLRQKLSLPNPLPFEDVRMEKAPSLRYVSKIAALAILASAKNELAHTDPEGYKVLVLALVCGLRRSEIDNLLWRAIDFPNALLRVESTEYHQLKSEDSAGEIDLDSDTLNFFKKHRICAPKSTFVIESPNPPSRGLRSRCYRCNAVFKRVNTWLRDQGVESNKPLHVLRKEIGSIIASEHGIFEASRYLRHSDIRITSAFYADKKKVVTPKSLAGLI